MKKIKLILKLLDWINQLISRINSFSEDILPQTVNATQALKKYVESDKSIAFKEFLKKYLGDKGDLVVDSFYAASTELAPKIAVQLNIWHEGNTAEISESEDFFKELAVKISDSKTVEGLWEQFWSDFCNKLLVMKVNGVSVSESSVLTKAYYETFVKGT